MSDALLQEVRELPNPDRSLLTHNERELIGLCNRLAEALAAAAEQRGREAEKEENARLREALACVKDLEDQNKPMGISEYMAAVRSRDIRITKLEAKNARLREALTTIEDENNWGSDGCWSSDSYPNEIARAALKGEKVE
jgi:hypothetical protein